jgi:hypothetical protein
MLPGPEGALGTLPRIIYMSGHEIACPLNILTGDRSDDELVLLHGFSCHARSNRLCWARSYSLV